MAQKDFEVQTSGILIKGLVPNVAIHPSGTQPTSSLACNSIGIGAYAAYSGQGAEAVAVGSCTGFCNQGTGAIAVGVESGKINQGVDAVAIGRLNCSRNL